MSKTKFKVGDKIVIVKPEEGYQHLVGLHAIILEVYPKRMPVDYLMALRGPFIAKRDAILDNPFRYYNPIYRRKLKEIDSQLDAIDIMISTLASQGSTKEPDLNLVILRVEKRLEE